ncbi:MAG: GntR family transcriptional regulator [Spirochaeta sp.]
MTGLFQPAGTIYEQIADSMETSILNGNPDEEQRVASVRASASELGVNVNTVVRAYGLLEERQVLHKERGLGYFVSADARSRIRLRRRQEFFAHIVPQLRTVLQQLDIPAEELAHALQHGPDHPSARDAE